MNDLIDRTELLKAFGLSEKTRKYGGDRSGYDTMMLYEIQDVIESLPSAQSGINKKELTRMITAGIIATNTKDVYSCGMRNGMRWCRALLEEDTPKFEDASLYAQSERERGTRTNNASYPNCGADMRGENDV